MHRSYLRPHPPYSAPGEWSEVYDPASVGEPIAPVPKASARGSTTSPCGFRTRRRRATPPSWPGSGPRYYGNVSHVDHELGRLWAAPVGYVAALRESSVLIAVFVGWRMLDEERGRLAGGEFGLGRARLDLSFRGPFRVHDGADQHHERHAGNGVPGGFRARHDRVLLVDVRQ